MSWSFSNDRPIFQQIVDIIVLDIISGKYPIGSKIETVRELAVAAGVNPNTMQRALSEIENIGIIYTKRGDGRYVTEDIDKINSVKNAYLTEKTRAFIKSVEPLGLTKQEIISAVNEEVN